MTRKEFCEKHRAEIEQISNILVNQGVDLGIAESIFCNAARLGKIPDGDDPGVRAALAIVGGSEYWGELAREYYGVIL